MNELDDFTDFCQSQIERLQGAFPDMRFYKATAIEELANWLEAKSGGDRQKAAAAITEATEYQQIPSIAQLNAMWARMFPPPKPAVNENCEHCGGTGWEEVSRKNGHGVQITGAQRCQNGCAVPARDAA